MLNHLLLASLIALSSSSTLAHADQAAPPVAGIMPMPTCTLNQRVPSSLFQIQQDLKAGLVDRDYVASTLIVYTTGGWTLQQIQQGKVIKTVTGCLDAASFKTLEGALSTATWKWSAAQLRCMADARDFTEYRYHGKLVFQTELCDGKVLDGKTTASLAAATAITNKIFQGALGKP